MVLLKKLSGLRQFRTVWIGGFPERQELPVSHPRGLVVTQDSRGARQANNRFRTVRCALQRFLKISGCFPGLIEFQQEITAEFSCRDDRMAAETSRRSSPRMRPLPLPAG